MFKAPIAGNKKIIIIEKQETIQGGPEIAQLTTLGEFLATAKEGEPRQRLADT